MNFAVVYLVQRFFYRIWVFIHDWYVGSFLFIGKACIDTLERLDRTWALAITVRNLFQPLYQDRTVIGRILGFIFRSLRSALAMIFYLFVICFFVAVYLAWVILPAYILWRGLSGLGVTITF